MNENQAVVIKQENADSEGVSCWVSELLLNLCDGRAVRWTSVICKCIWNSHDKQKQWGRNSVSLQQ
jgi:hypothetical protein